MTVVLSGQGLDLTEIAAVGRGEEVRLSDASSVLGRVERSRQVIRDAIE